MSAHAKAELARYTLELERRAKEKRNALPLMRWMPRVSPGVIPPTWLSPIVNALNLAVTEPVRIAFSTPPQHGKSTLLLHWIVWMLARMVRNVIYVTHGAKFAVKQSRDALRIADGAALEFEKPRSAEYWRLTSGGTLLPVGIEGGLAGNPGGAIIIDDLYRTWQVAQSAVYRDRIHDELQASVLSRVDPRTPIVMVMTRWHVDDEVARLIKQGWTWVNLPAINEHGEALSPLRPIEFLETMRAQLAEWLWWAMWMGSPRKLGGEVFKDVTWYQRGTEPKEGRRGIGVDFAYSTKSRNDWTVFVVGVKHGRKLYVTAVHRFQQKPEVTSEVLKLERKANGNCRARWYYGGQEEEIINLFARLGVHVDGVRATDDKLVRSAKTAAAWNRGDILLPLDMVEDGEDVAPVSEQDKAMAQFAQVITSFTGSGDRHDDDVDALAGLHDLLEDGEIIEPKTIGGGSGVDQEILEVY